MFHVVFDTKPALGRLKHLSRRQTTRILNRASNRALAAARTLALRQAAAATGYPQKVLRRATILKKATFDKSGYLFINLEGIPAHRLGDLDETGDGVSVNTSGSTRPLESLANLPYPAFLGKARGKGKVMAWHRKTANAHPLKLIRIHLLSPEDFNRAAIDARLNEVFGKRVTHELEQAYKKGK
ncbi:MAG: hypothetical protein QNK37_20695 [Acidobacteriota bacterium]|nr:hypothetical protein [Acidobacteriota bacterium]